MKKSNMPLYKAQMGGGTENAQMYERMATSIQEAIKRGQTPQVIYQSLLARKMDQKIAMQLVSSVVRFMMESGELEEEGLEQAEQKDQQAQQALDQDQMLMAEEKDAAAQQQMDVYRQQSMDAAMDTSAMDQTEEDYNNDTEDILGFQEGGPYSQTSYSSLYETPEGTEETEETVSSDGSNFSLDALVAETAGTQNLNFPGLEEYYLPYAPLVGSNLEVPDYTPTAKYGGSQKKKFAKNVMALLKKQQGGPQEDEVVDAGIAKQTDDLTGTVKKKQSSFVEAVGNTAKKVKIDEFFNKLQETQDPLLDQILSPVPQQDPAQEQMMQAQSAIGQEEMRRGGQKRAKRKYNKLINRTNKLLGIDEAEEMDIALAMGNLPLNQYNKYDNFVDQRFNTIDIPTLQKYFADLSQQQLQQDRVIAPIVDVYETGIFGRPKKYRVMYPQANTLPAELQAKDAEIKNNIKNELKFDPEQDGIIDVVPEGTMNPNANLAMAEYGGQYGGFVDPSLPDLTRFVYGGNDFPEEAKNVNDPYFMDMGQYQDGGMMFPTQDQDLENPMHHLNLYSQSTDIFKQPMNSVESFRKGGPKRKDIRNRQRMTNSTLRDSLIPINRLLDYTGSYAQQAGLPTYYGSNAYYEGSMEGAPLIMSDVSKRGILGRPKEWTDYYLVNSTGAVDLSQHPMFAQSQQDQQIQESDYSDLGLRSRMAINKGERQVERQQERAIRKGYDQPVDQEMQMGGAPEIGMSEEDENFDFYRRLTDSMYYQPQLRRGGYLPMAFEGLENTPVSYTSNPAFEGMKEVDFTVAPGANTNLEPSSIFSDMQSFNPEPPAPTFTQPEAITMPEGYKEYQQPKSTSADKPAETIKAPQLVGINRTRQDTRVTDPEAAINAFNSVGSFGLGLANRKQQREQEAQMYEQNFNPMKLYGKKERMDRGDYEVNQGSYSFDTTGANRLGSSKQYGGPMFKEGGENITFMSEEQIQEFLAAGGEIEFL